MSTQIRWLGQVDTTRPGCGRVPLPPFDPSAGVLTSCTKDFLTSTAACKDAIAAVVANMSKLWWGLPVPTPYEVEVLNWAFHYGFLSCSVRDTYCRPTEAASPACRVSMEEALFYDSEKGSAPRYPYPLAQWLKDASKYGPIIVDRVLDSQGTWDITKSTFIAIHWPAPSNNSGESTQSLIQAYMFFNQTLASVMSAQALADSFRMSDAVEEYSRILCGLAQGAEGLLGSSRNWVCVYAPRILALSPLAV